MCNIKHIQRMPNCMLDVQSMANSRMSIAPGAMGAGTGSSDAAQLRREMGVKEQRCNDLEKAKDKLERAQEALKTELATVKEEAAASKKELKKTCSKTAALERCKEDSEKVDERHVDACQNVT